MRPMLTASADEAVLPSAWTYNETGRLSSAIDAAKASQSREIRADLDRLAMT